MLDLKSKNNCCGCSACQNVCPVHAIEMCEDEQKFKYPKINSEICVNCGLCKKVCPILNSKDKKVQNFPQAYAAYNKNEQIRRESSSGGIFTEIAKTVLIDNGIVFGASFDENFNVSHVSVTNEFDLKKLRGSKYIQSDINNNYIEAKKYLDEGRKVLFTGTPCQIEGLHSFLRKEYENLYTQDLICHGVPSKLAWEKYIEYRKQKENGKELKNIFFRDKSQSGWSNYEVCFDYENISTKINHNDDMFMKIFLSDIILRPSCYDCKFKKVNRISDITLADFWGIDNVVPEMNDEKGTCLLIVHSEKGLELLQNINDKICIKEVEFEKAISGNLSMIKSPSIEKYRPEFYIDCNNMSIEELVNKYI